MRLYLDANGDGLPTGDTLLDSGVFTQDDGALDMTFAATTIGANATIVCGVELGAYAFVGAGAVVTANVKPYALVVGVPARQVGWMCQCGERLQTVGGARRPVENPERIVCAACGSAYSLEGEGLFPEGER